MSFDEFLQRLATGKGLFKIQDNKIWIWDNINVFLACQLTYVCNKLFDTNYNVSDYNLAGKKLGFEKETSRDISIAADYEKCENNTQQEYRRKIIEVLFDA